MRKHEHRFDAPHRGQRRCKICGRQQFTVEKGIWRDEMTLPMFADSWLPAISGTNPRTMMNIQVAFPFEWNCYESWKPVWRVQFDLGPVDERLTTPIHVLDQWESKWQECWVRIDHEARIEFEKRTGKPYMIGDNTYAEMRRIIQS